MQCLLHVINMKKLFIKKGNTSTSLIDYDVNTLTIPINYDDTIAFRNCFSKQFVQIKENICFLICSKSYHIHRFILVIIYKFIIELIFRCLQNHDRPFYQNHTQQLK